MYLVYRALERDPVPHQLPANLIPPSKRTRGPPTSAVHVLPTLPSLNNVGGLASLGGLTSLGTATSGLDTSLSVSAAVWHFGQGR